MADERLQQVLVASLDTRKEIRQAAEAELARLSKEPSEVYRMELDHLRTVPRHRPSCLPDSLSRYIDAHWSEVSEKFEPPLTPQELRPRIRQALFQGLSHPYHGIRASCAHSIAGIAKYDWPDYWPNLMDDLIRLLREGAGDQMEAAMDVVTELIKEDFGPDQLPNIASNLLPTLLDILRNDQASWIIRARTLEIFEEIVSMFTTVREEHPQMVKQALGHFGTVWIAEMDKFISSDLDVDLKRDPGLLTLRCNSFKVFTALDRDFAKFFEPYRAHILQMGVRNLTAVVPHYQLYCVNTSHNAPKLPNDYDESLIFDSIIVDILEYAARAGRHPSVRNLMVQTHDDQETGTGLLYQLIAATTALMQVSAEAMFDWVDDVNNFLLDDDEESGARGSRGPGYDLIGSLIDRYPDAVAAVIQQVLVNTVQATMSARQNVTQDWWQPLEAVLAMLIALSDDIESILVEDQSAGRQPTIALGQLYTEIISGILADTDDDEIAIIQSRSLLFAAAYAGLLPQDAVVAAFSTAVKLLESEDAEQLGKMSATKAIKNFCRHINPEVVQARSQHIMSILLPNMRDLKDEMLYLVLETLRAILAIDKNALNPESTRALALVTFETWLQNSTDPVATAVVEELFEVVAAGSTPNVVHALVVTLSPRLAAILASPTNKDNEHLPAEAVQLANSLIRTRGGPLEPELISTVTAAVMTCLQATEDMHVVQHGMFHLTQVVRKDCDKLLQWRSSTGVSGTDTILHLLSKFLSPQFPETGGIFVGDLIIHLLRKASSAIGSILPDLLQALVVRLAGAKLPSFVEALVLPFAYLFGTDHSEDTLGLLNSLPNPAPETYQSALHLVLRKWCEMSDDVNGSWNIRVNALGLARLYANPDPILREVHVRGGIIIDDSTRDVIVTRSKAKANPPRYHSIPFPAQCLKMILKELQTFESAAKSKGKKVSSSTVDIEEDDGDDEWDDDDALGGGPEGKGEFDYLSSWLDNDGGGDMEAQDDDEDLRNDPVTQVDMVEHLINVLRHCYTTNVNGMHDQIEGLNDMEKAVLRGALTL